ncbi:MAG: DNA phosphorothioation-associated protein 4 [Sphaerospermopsis sp.]|uniref:DNA phosphorothioation-associated protein 4 n=1 Tax=Sphaerospermopsis aphanizomenoides LEGE 00250 TaxID=2777972 RepID=A0ABR9VC33_9CYAN|nr:MULTISPECIES: DNA phosphorothioation-associated protein 4 [Sphaerospermopsis]MBD2147333.1 DNA phosphorothioation-associated protein 4 [Sphaerospermopsis sp. FACHB-1194]MBE9236062.1 DNA phosphorothioation-associated protein 4 [Sphaerospermopsis aphanizomenoides LEGE 00250]MEB3147883.1 DNA phosphorothioation-associated protein 4 [Sphaerospermopsis sp.]
MAESGRIRVAKDKADLVKSLISSDGGNGPFQTFADVIVFAAALGVKYKKRVPFEEVSKREPSPIPQEQFIVRSYDVVINLLAVTDTENISLLSFNDGNNNEIRNRIFEEYANGGLEILRGELRGAVDYSERILLFLHHQRFPEEFDGDFDLTRFI